MSMVMNALNDVWLDTYHTYPTYHNPRRIRKVEKLHENTLNFKDIENSSLSYRYSQKLKERIPSVLVLLVRKIRSNIQSMFDKNVLKILLIGEGEKKHYVLLKILTHSCMITHYIVEEDIFVGIVYERLEQQMY